MSRFELAPGCIIRTMMSSADPIARAFDSIEGSGAPQSDRAIRICVVIITRDRVAKLSRVLDDVSTLVPAPTQIIVVDNASTDETPQRLANDKRVQLIRLNDNMGIESFNIGAAATTCECLLILDDDAAPEPESWSRAIKLLNEDASIDAIAFNPIHPETGATEWPDAVRSCKRFNRMGCANLIRTEVWKSSGGYLGAYFLYRNDTDLALTILSADGSIHFDPTLRALHDSPFTAKKSDRWLRLATRNWIWMGRRHGRGLWKLLGILAGVCRACMFAGVSAPRLGHVFGGVREALMTTPPMPRRKSDGLAWKSLITGRLGM